MSELERQMNMNTALFNQISVTKRRPEKEIKQLQKRLEELGQFKDKTSEDLCK